MNNTTPPDQQTIVWCADANMNGCSDERNKRSVTIAWTAQPRDARGIQNGTITDDSRPEMLPGASRYPDQAPADGGPLAPFVRH